MGTCRSYPAEQCIVDPPIAHVCCAACVYYNMLLKTYIIYIYIYILHGSIPICGLLRTKRGALKTLQKAVRLTHPKEVPNRALVLFESRRINSKSLSPTTKEMEEAAAPSIVAPAMVFFTVRRWFPLIGSVYMQLHKFVSLFNFKAG